MFTCIACTYSPLAALLGVRDNVRTLSVVRWKARGRLPIRDNWMFFASSYCSDFMTRYWSKSAFFKEGWFTLSANVRWDGTSPTNLCWCQKPFHVVSKYLQYVLSFRHKARMWRTGGRTNGWTDRQTYRQNYDSQDRASIAASRGKNWVFKGKSAVNVGGTKSALKFFWSSKNWFFGGTLQQNAL